MSATTLGRNLLAEIQEESLDEVRGKSLAPLHILNHHADDHSRSNLCALGRLQQAGIMSALLLWIGSSTCSQRRRNSIGDSKL